MFTKATKSKSRLRLALSGPSGAGKTYSALSIASGLGDRIALIDTERGSASKYAGIFDFDVCELQSFHPAKYVEAINAASNAQYDAIVIDSLSHAWFAELDMAAGQFANWAKIKPLERALLDAILQCKAHVIVTMRSKTEWIMEDTTNRQGKAVQAPKRVGTSPMQSSGIEYEFDIAGEMDLNHILSISKSRCPDLANSTHLNPGRPLAESLLSWLSDGVSAPPAPAAPAAPMAFATASDLAPITKALTDAGLNQAQRREWLQAKGFSSPGQIPQREIPGLLASAKAVKAVNGPDELISGEDAEAIASLAKKHTWPDAAFRQLLSDHGFIAADGNPSATLIKKVMLPTMTDFVADEAVLADYVSAVAS
jgi:hypothetical protein